MGNKILIISPSLEPYGGVRVISNWAKYFDLAGHDVTLCSINGPMADNWFIFDGQVKLKYGWPDNLLMYDTVIATNPDTALWLRDRNAKKKLYLCQMAEELFNPDADSYVERCNIAANVPFDMITVAEWVQYRYRERTHSIHVVPNGIDDNFRLTTEKDEEITILVEGWECNNAAKDTDSVTSHSIGLIKKEIDIKVIAYGQQPLSKSKELISEYHERPTTDQLNTLYNRTHFFVKASKYETRSLAPMEAMACGCIPVVSIIQGHPDLLHRYNGLRAKYTAFDLYTAIKEAVTSDMKHTYKYNGLKTVNGLRWNEVINQKILPLIET